MFWISLIETLIEFSSTVIFHFVLWQQVCGWVVCLHMFVGIHLHKLQYDSICLANEHLHVSHDVIFHNSCYCFQSFPPPLSWHRLPCVEVAVMVPALVWSWVDFPLHHKGTGLTCLRWHRITLQANSLSLVYMCMWQQGPLHHLFLAMPVLWLLVWQYWLDGWLVDLGKNISVTIRCRCSTKQLFLVLRGWILMALVLWQQIKKWLYLYRHISLKCVNETSAHVTSWIGVLFHADIHVKQRMSHKDLLIRPFFF